MRLTAFFISRTFIVLFAFFLSNTAYGQYTKWQKNISNNNIKFERVRFIIHETDTTYTEGVLAQKTIIDGKEYNKNTELFFDETGIVISAR